MSGWLNIQQPRNYNIHLEEKRVSEREMEYYADLFTEYKAKRIQIQRDIFMNEIYFRSQYKPSGHMASEHITFHMHRTIELSHSFQMQT